MKRDFLFLPQTQIIHVDIDNSVINKIKKASLPICSDIGLFLKEILPLTSYCQTQEWHSFCFDLKSKNPLPFFAEKDNYALLRPEAVIDAFSRHTEGKAILISDVGQHQMFAALYYKFAYPASHITSGGLGTMGYSLPAAIGVCLANTKQLVLSFSGDGGFQMNLPELATVKAYNLPIVICILNNGNLGMVKQWQDLFWNEQYAATILDSNPDFTAIAKAYGIKAIRCSKQEDLEEVVKQCCDITEPIVVEFIIDPEAHVYPMIPSGTSVNDIRLCNYRTL